MTSHQLHPLWPEMADGSIITQLDILFTTLSILSLIHCISKRGFLSGTITILFLFLHTILFEHASLFLGGTHCHASSTILPMISPCSSINSVLFYIPWLYTSIEGAKKLNLHIAAYPFAVGLLQLGFGACYECQGPMRAFWKWPDENGTIADSPEILSSWSGYPPLKFLKDAQVQNEVGTISEDGVFHVSQHADEALSERLWKFPLYAPYFHFAYGFAWAFGLSLSGEITSQVALTTKQWFVAGLGAFVLFLQPIWFTGFLSDKLNLSLVQGVPLSLGLSLLPILILPKQLPTPPISDGNKRGSSSSSSSQTSDLLLFGICFTMHAFFVSFPWRIKEHTPTNFHLFIACVSTVHLIAQYYCCFLAGKQQQQQQQQKKQKTI